MDLKISSNLEELEKLFGSRMRDYEEKLQKATSGGDCVHPDWASLSSGNGEVETKSDLPVKELEKLKLGEGDKATASKSEHVEYHSLDAVEGNGKMLTRLEQHASADSVNGEKPRVHAQAELDVPSAGVHRVLLQDGSQLTVLDATAATTAASDELLTTKVFHGAARLVQPGSGTNTPQSHTAVRRANSEVLKPPTNQLDYTGLQYSPLNMAEYIAWSGDERGVTNVIEDFIQSGLMTKEEAIKFLQEVKYNLDIIRVRYSQNSEISKGRTQQEKLRNMLVDQINAKDYQYHGLPQLQSFQFSGQDLNRPWDISNHLSSLPALPIYTDLRQDMMKRQYDPMLQYNVISTSDYDREEPVISEEEYEEMMEKLKAYDTLYTEYTLEEIIYQLAKMMFSQSLSRDPASARAATQRFMNFLNLEAERGHISRSIEKKVLEVMIAALTDTIGDHPELIQSHDGIPFNSANRLMRQFLESSASEPGMSRALLAEDEWLKGPLRRK